MADLSITPANVIAGSNASISRATAGVALTAGQVVYQEDATGLIKLCDTNSATAEVRTPEGIALHAAAINQPIAFQTAGDITIGATLVAGSAYYASETPGGIEPAADLTATENVALLGLAKSTTVLALRITVPGVIL